MKDLEQGQEAEGGEDEVYFLSAFSSLLSILDSAFASVSVCLLSISGVKQPNSSTSQ